MRRGVSVKGPCGVSRCRLGGLHDHGVPPERVNEGELIVAGCACRGGSTLRGAFSATLSFHAPAVVGAGWLAYGAAVRGRCLHRDNVGGFGVVCSGCHASNACRIST